MIEVVLNDRLGKKVGSCAVLKRKVMRLTFAPQHRAANCQHGKALHGMVTHAADPGQVQRG